MTQFGMYREGNSLAHRLDPRTKIMFVLLFFIAAFAAQGVALAAVAVVAVAALCASRIGPAQALRMLKPFVWLMVFVFVFDVLFTRGADVLCALGPVAITSEGVLFAAESIVRFCLMLLGTSALMYTTSPTELTDAFSLMFKPLRKVGINAKNAALALGLTLRFIPLIVQEFTRVVEAQRARGAKFSGGVATRLKAYGPVFVSLFAGAMRRADTLALAIENREYSDAAERTCIRGYRLRPADGVVLLVSVALVLAALLIAL